MHHQDIVILVNATACTHVSGVRCHHLPNEFVKLRLAHLGTRLVPDEHGIVRVKREICLSVPILDGSVQFIKNRQCSALRLLEWLNHPPLSRIAQGFESERSDLHLGNGGSVRTPITWRKRSGVFCEPIVPKKLGVWRIAVSFREFVPSRRQIQERRFLGRAFHEPCSSF